MILPAKGGGEGIPTSLTQLTYVYTALNGSATYTFTDDYDVVVATLQRNSNGTSGGIQANITVNSSTATETTVYTYPEGSYCGAISKYITNIKSGDSLTFIGGRAAQYGSYMVYGG